MKIKQSYSMISPPKAPKVVVVIQGQEYSSLQAYLMASGAKTVTIAPGVNIQHIGIDKGYKSMMQLFSDQTKYKLFSVGDASRVITPQEIIETLKLAAAATIANQSSEMPLIIVAAHGMMCLTPDPSMTSHGLCLDINPPHNLTSDTILSTPWPTSLLFKEVSTHFGTHAPVELVLYSCQSGRTKQYVNLLPQGSTLTTFTNDDSSISTVTMVNASKHLIEHPAEGRVSAVDLLQGFFATGNHAINLVSISTSGKKLMSFAEFCEKDPELLSQLAESSAKQTEFKELKALELLAQECVRHTSLLTSKLHVYVQRELNDVGAVDLKSLVDELNALGRIFPTFDSVACLATIAQNTGIDINSIHTLESSAASASAATIDQALQHIPADIEAQVVVADTPHSDTVSLNGLCSSSADAAAPALATPTE